MDKVQKCHNSELNSFFYYYYILQLGFHPVAVVLTLVHTIQIVFMKGKAVPVLN
jgi:hypothetical protein